MFISERKLLTHMTTMLGSSVFFALFGAIYEQFSHQVYSYYMIYAFALPLILGALPWALALGRGWRIPEEVPGLWNAAVLTSPWGACCGECWTSTAPPATCFSSTLWQRRR